MSVFLENMSISVEDLGKYCKQLSDNIEGCKSGEKKFVSFASSDESSSSESPTIHCCPNSVPMVASGTYTQLLDLPKPRHHTHSHQSPGSRPS